MCAQAAKISVRGPGSYVLILFLRQRMSIAVGKLGKINFPAGYYAYVGSALGPGGLAARLSHHLFSNARPHWHIDYLRRQAKTEEIWVTEFDQSLEHSWASLLRRLSNTDRLFKGFGCSDCKCPSHLFYFPGRPSFKLFSQCAGNNTLGLAFRRSRMFIAHGRKIS